MDIESFKEVKPLSGFLSASVFENEFIGLKPTLFFGISIPLETFKFQNEKVDTTVELDFIHLPVRNDWKELIGNSYSFPINPENGYIDGSVYLGHAHNPADTSKVSFIENRGVLKCALEITFDFTFEGPSFLGKPSVKWEIELRYDEDQISNAIKEIQAIQSA
ncbi:hypothetical protein ACFOND_14415 [Reinekea marina]|uniref:Immunity protein 50 of polymorphic toxin system n=1 Tax=Reinekea marina TaxID=1310421 RepID=A0ABV7WWI4_9GAMM